MKKSTGSVSEDSRLTSNGLAEILEIEEIESKVAPDSIVIWTLLD